MASAESPGTQGIASRGALKEARQQGQRRIAPEAGRALELLGHAIEYLTDEYVLEAKYLSPTDPQVKAILILMDLNRKVYLECPKIPTVAERIREFLGGGRAPVIE